MAVVEYGPPAHKGVTTIMGVGDVEPARETDRERLHRYASNGGLISFGLWTYAYLVGDERLQKYTFGSSVACALLQLATKRWRR